MNCKRNGDPQLNTQAITHVTKKLGPRMLTDRGSVFVKHQGDVVIRFSVAWFCNAALRVMPVANLVPGTPLRQLTFQLQNARSAVDEIRGCTILSSVLRSSVPSANDLIGVLDAVTEKITDEATLEHLDAANIAVAVQQWWIAFAAELDVLDTYFVRRKGGFDTLGLIESGEMVFPASLGEKVPECIDDIRMEVASKGVEIGDGGDVPSG